VLDKVSLKMTDDKVNSDKQTEYIELGIQTDSVPFINCPGCGVEIETGGIASFTEIVCPNCRTRQTVPARLDNFRLLRVIGVGGMGAVFLAQDDNLRRRVAIKVMQSAIVSDPAFFASFQKEARAAAKLNHPNVVQIYSFGMVKNQPYLVMELVDGHKLDELIKSTEPLDPAFVLRVGREVINGLRAAQAANLIHGDIKPENILLDNQLKAKLVDFGIASLISSKESGEEIWGTPFYVAPEKAQHRKADIRADIYSLGATLYHAVSGKVPFDGPDAAAVIRARFEGPAAPLISLRPDIEPPAAAIIERMMRFELPQRYPNYNSLLKDVEKYLAAVPEVRQQGPQIRKITTLRSSAGMTSSGGLLSASGGMQTSGNTAGLSATSKQTGGQASDTSGMQGGGASTTARKGLVIHKGALAAGSSTRRRRSVPSTRPQSRVPTTARPRATTAEIPKSGHSSAKTLVITLMSLFALLIIGGILAIVLIAGAQRRKEKEMVVLYNQAQGMEDQIIAFDEDLANGVKVLASIDADASKVIAAAGDIVQKALGTELKIPDLEPPAVTLGDSSDAGEEEADKDDDGAPPPPPSVDDDGEDTEIAGNAADGTDASGVTAAEDASGEALDGDDGEEPARASDEPPLIARASTLFEPARAIRAKLRLAEAMRDRPKPVFESLKPAAMTRQAWNARNNIVTQKQADIAAMTAAAEECTGFLLTMRRAMPNIEKEAEVLLVAARRRAEAEEKAKKEAEAEAARAQALAEAEAKEAQERDFVKGEVQKRQEMIAKYDYERVAMELERMRDELLTDGGKEELESSITKFKRLDSLKQFIVKDLHDHKGLRRGLGNLDIVDADKEFIHTFGDRKIAWQDVNLGQWINLISRLLELRPRERPLGAIERGEQLFNSAIFCIIHAGDSTSAEDKALVLLKLSLQRRSALRMDVPKLLPGLVEKLDD
jgi:serine/threonine protein kinase